MLFGNFGNGNRCSTISRHDKKRNVSAYLEIVATPLTIRYLVTTLLVARQINNLSPFYCICHWKVLRFYSTFFARGNMGTGFYILTNSHLLFFFSLSSVIDRQLNAAHFCPFAVSLAPFPPISSVPRRFPFLASIGLSVGVMIERTQVFQTGAITELILVLPK